jgi:hypothetical protein
VAVAESLLSREWLLKNQISKLVKESVRRPSVVVCKPTKGATTDRNPLEIVKRRIILASAVVIETIDETTTVKIMIVRTDTQLSVLLHPCHPFLLSASQDIPSHCQLSLTACRCFLLDSLLSLVNRQHNRNNPHHLDIAIEPLPTQT